MVFVSFFRNHGLCTKGDLLQWFAVENNSRSYIKPLTKKFEERIKTNVTIVRVSKHSAGVSIVFNDGTEAMFDEVVFATHSDTALALLDPDFTTERNLLGQLPYSTHEVVLHTDSSLIPKSRNAWASWNIRVQTGVTKPIFSYWMNLLQGMQAPVDFFVTLDAGTLIAPEKVLYKTTYHHPIISTDSVLAQNKWSEINGHNHVWFVGAYWRNGFHEDGVWSGIRVAQALGVDLGIFSETFKTDVL